MKHLITGGSGFIGNLTARRLRERGDGVRLLDIWADPSRPKDIAFINSSVLDRDGVAAAMRDVDVVHHNAALVVQTDAGRHRSEEHTSELQSLMRISYAVFCLKKKKNK